MSDPQAKPRILVIDDEPMILQILRAAFEHKDWEVEVVSEGRMALRRHRARPFDLMIVDKNLPDIDGISLVRELRSETDHVKVVLITGYGTVTSAVESLNLGVSAYLEKPFRRITEVAATVEDALSRQVKLPTSRVARPAAARPAAARAAVEPPAAKPRRLKTDPRAPRADAAGAPRRAEPDPEPIAGPELAAEAEGDGADEFEVEVRTGRWVRQAAPVAAVIIGAPDDDARLRLGAVVTAARGQAVFAADTMAVLVAVASHDAGLVVLVGPMGRPETVARLRAQAPDVPCVLITDHVTITAVQELMQLQATHLITDPPGSDAARERLAEILRQLAAGELPAAGAA
jgi:DNA-binding NtrC family response regulator